MTVAVITNMAGRKVLIRKVIIDVVSIFLIYLPWIVLNSGIQPFRRGLYCDDESIRHPYHDSTIPGTVLVFVSMILPISVILVIEGLQTWKKKLESIGSQKIEIGGWNVPVFVIKCYMLIGYFILGAVFQQTVTNIGKYSVGRLRPHFIDICKPNYNAINCTDSQGIYQYIEDDVCTTNDLKKLKESRLSFPSGHASLSTYCMVYLVIYLQARMTWKELPLLRPLCQVLALWLAFYTCLSRISDYKHHWSDVLAGTLLGAGTAVVVAVYLSGMFPKLKTSSVIQELDEIQSRHGSNSPSMYELHQSDDTILRKI